MPPANTPSTPSVARGSPLSPPIEHPPLQYRPLTPLSYLSSPVPDLASTLHTAAADEADEANLSFLRTSLESLEERSHGPRRSYVDSSRDPRLNDPSSAHPARGQPGAAQSRSENPVDILRRERLQRVLSRLNRPRDPAVSSAAAYSNRTPSPGRQNIYDWAPSYDDDLDDSEIDTILRDLRRQQPGALATSVRAAAQSQPDGQARRRERESSDTPAPADMTEATGRSERLREREQRRRQSESTSLRTRAAMQRSRQDASPSATDRMLRFMLEREYSGLSEEEERARGSGWFGSTASQIDSPQSVLASGLSWLQREASTDPTAGDRQQRLDAFRRGYLPENGPPRPPRVATPLVPATTCTAASASTGGLEDVLSYLSELRWCRTYEEALSTAIDHGLATKEFFADNHDDFIMDLCESQPVEESSWLQPGAVFQGHQSAANVTSVTHQSPALSTVHSIEQINPNYQHLSSLDQPPGSRTTNSSASDTLRPWLSSNSEATSKSSSDLLHDQWPVRVVIHAIDPEKMSIQGTMEAYDVPQNPPHGTILGSAGVERPKAGRKNAPITTYLEGHIIDLRTHSFLTTELPASRRSTSHRADSIAFPPASAATDAANWRRLPPFASQPSAAATVRTFASKSGLAALQREFVFMRWKERCFVHAKDDPCPERDRTGDQDRGHGLTISGFYYVSLRRSDGCVEGLYYDPTSTPYQHLRLRGQASGWPSFGFR